MIRAALYLISCSVKNRLTRWASRLRQPRYLAGSILAGIYLWTFLFKRRASVTVRPPHLSHLVAADLFVLVLTILALTILVGAWALAGEEPAFVFSEAEIQFLFPAPLSRRQLLGYKVLQSQIGLLFTSAVMWFFAFRGSHYLGMWLAVAVINTYTMFVSFARARLKLAGIGFLTRLGVVLLVTIGILGLVSWQIRTSQAAILQALAATDMNTFGRLLTAALTRPPLGYILALPRLFGEVVYAPPGALLVRDAALLIAMAVVFFFGAVKLNVSFEDASIVASQRALARRARMRGARSGNASAVRRFPPLFKLAARGRPEVAIFWKNLIAAFRVSSFPFIAAIVPIAFAAAAAIFRRNELSQTLGICGLIVTAAFLFAGPQAIRADLRLDLLRLDLVKAFPVSAEALIAAELAAPLILISIFELGMVALSLLLLNFSSMPSGFITSPEFAVCAMVFIVPVSAIQLLIQNGAMILFPAWGLGLDTGRGITGLGQRMLLLLGNLVTLAIALGPAALLLAGSMFAATRFFGSAPAVLLLSTLPAAALLVGEAAIAHRFLAAQFEEIDIANDLENATP